MADLFWSAFELFSDFWDQFLFLFLVNCQLPDERRNWKHNVATLCILGSILSVMHQANLPQIVSFPVMFTLHFSYCFFFRRGSLHQRLMWPMVARYIYSSGNMITVFIVTHLPGFDMRMVIEHTPQRFIAVCIHMSIVSALFFVASRIHPRSSSLPHHTQVISGIMSLVCALFVGIIFDLTPAGMSQEGAWLLQVAVWGFMLMSLAWLYLLDSLAARNAELYDLQLEQQRLASEQMQVAARQELYDRLRDLRHDFQNQMLALIGYVRQRDMQGLEDHLYKLQIELSDGDELTLTDYPQLDTLLSSKLHQARSLGIHTEILFAVPSILPMNPVDLCSVIGNVLDNALEATQQLPETKRHISILAGPANDMWQIRVSNSCNGEYKHDDAHGYLTTKEGDWRGRGLRRIKQLVERHDGDVLLVAGTDTFIVDILLPCGAF